MKTPSLRRYSANLRSGPPPPAQGMREKIEAARDPRHALGRLLPYLIPFKALLIAVCGLVVVYHPSGADRSLPDGGGHRPVHRREGAGRPGADLPLDARHLPDEQPLPGGLGVAHGRRFPARPQKSARGSLLPPADPPRELFRRKPGGRADEPPDERHRGDQPGRLAERHLASGERPFPDRDPGGHVRSGRVAGAGLASGRSHHVRLHRVRRPVHAPGFPGAADASGRTQRRDGGGDQRPEGGQGVPPERVGARRLPPEQSGGVSRCRLGQQLCLPAHAADERPGELLRDRPGGARRLARPQGAGHRRDHRDLHQLRAELHQPPAAAREHVQLDPGRARRGRAGV